MDAPQRKPYHPAAILREIWDRFPVWFLYIQYLGLLHFVVANVPDEMFRQAGVSQWGVSLTAFIPASVVTAYYFLRARRSDRIRRFPLAATIIGFFTLGIPILIYWLYESGTATRHILSRDQIILFFEISQIVWFMLIFIHSAAKRGLPGILLFWGVAMVYGVVLENGGIILRYFFEDHFRFYLFRLPAPVATMFGWVMVMYVCTSIADAFADLLPRVDWTPGRSALLATAVALALDLQLDPMASLSGVWWRWNDRLPAAWFGVPAINFVAWFSAVLPFTYAYYWVQRHARWSPVARVWQLFLRLHVALIAAVILNFGIMAVYEAATGHGFLRGPTFQILADFLNTLLPYG